MAKLSLKEKATFWKRCRTDIHYFARLCLRILVLMQGIPVWISFVLNAEQLDLLQTLLSQSSQGVPERAIVCKARKLGMSTLILAIAYWRCCFIPGYRALVIAHRKESTEEIALIALGFNEQMPKHLRRRLGAKPKNHGLLFPNGSYIKVQTGRSDHAARGASPHLVLMSEAASYEYQRAATTGEDSISATMGSIDYVPGTTIVLESTALGPFGAFFNRYELAEQAERVTPGSAMFKPKFYPWQHSQKYNSPTPGFTNTAEQLALDHHFKTASPESRHLITAQLGYDATWAKRALDHDLTPAQVLWAQRQVSGTYGNDLTKFDREFPVSAAVAFMSGEGSVFPTAQVDAWLRLPPASIQGIAVRHLTDSQEVDSLRKQAIKENSNCPFWLTPGGDAWWIWKLPELHHEYVVGCDVGAGGGADYSCIEVLDRHTLEQVAEFYCNKTPPDVLGEQVAEICAIYNNAFAVIERNADGGTTIKACLDAGHSNMYRRNSGKELKPGQNWIQSFGFVTNEPSRRDLVTTLIAAVRDCEVAMLSRRFGIEASSFVYDKKGRADHKSGKHSDAHIATGLALFGHGFLSMPKALPVIRPAATMEPKFEKALATMRAKAYEPKKSRRGLGL